MKARVTWDYLGDVPVISVVNRARVKSFRTVNLFLSYEHHGDGLLGGTTIALNLDNVFDTAPAYRNQAGGIGNGSTFGRLLNITLEKKF